MPFKLRYFLLCLTLGVLGLLITILTEIFPLQNDVKSLPPIVVKISDDFIENKTQRNCKMHSCFDHFKCPLDSNWKIKVFIYPEIKYKTSEEMEIFPAHSNEFMKMIKGIKESPFLTSDPRKACVFIPNIDTLSEKRIFRDYAGKSLSTLKYWNNGQNHILFNFFQEKTSSANPLTINTGQAIVASGSFNLFNFRQRFDISIPIPNTLIQTEKYSMQPEEILSLKKRNWLLAIPDGIVLKSMESDFEKLIDLKNKDVLHLSYCRDYTVKDSVNKRCGKDSYYNYPGILKQSEFCMIITSFGLWKTFLSDAMMSGCIPIFFQDHVLPFHSILDWKRASITINKNQVETLIQFLKSFDQKQRTTFRKQAVFLWKEYFSSLEKIALTAIEIINDRMSPQLAKTYSEWNGEVYTIENGEFTEGNWPKFFVPLSPVTDKGFTAVILTYNRIQMLYELVEKLSRCPSLSKIIIIWNNQNKAPPPKSSWPKINKPWMIIESKENKLTNRFYPYQEIETEAVLSIDDDISMLTETEVEFAFKVWKEYPDRLVGFPGRYHRQSDMSSNDAMQYQSRWSNDISMVLTGVAFYHNIYNYMFTHNMPFSGLQYIDGKMNCEDIAMNFLIANITRKAPIKVTARKRFICKQCTNNETLWSETSFLKRTECLRVFTDLFGKMPLQTVEFRADPVLFKENVPAEIQEFPDMGMV